MLLSCPFGAGEEGVPVACKGSSREQSKDKKIFRFQGDHLPDGQQESSSMLVSSCARLQFSPFEHDSDVPPAGEQLTLAHRRRRALHYLPDGRTIGDKSRVCPISDYTHPL